MPHHGNHGKFHGMNTVINSNARQVNANRLDLEAHRAERKIKSRKWGPAASPFYEVECHLCAKMVRFYHTKARGRSRIEFHYASCGLPCGVWVCKDAYIISKGQMHGRNYTCPDCGPITENVLERFRRIWILKKLNGDT